MIGAQGLQELSRSIWESWKWQPSEEHPPGDSFFHEQLISSAKDPFLIIVRRHFDNHMRRYWREDDDSEIKDETIEMGWKKNIAKLKELGYYVEELGGNHAVKITWGTEIWNEMFETKV